MRDDSIKNNKSGEEPKNYAPPQSAEEAKNRAEKAKRPDALSGMVFHAMRMMAGTLVSRVLGLVREMLTAALFGATRQLDAFFVAYTLANLSRQLLAEGALSASFVPVFSRTLASDGRDSAKRLADEALTILIFGCSAVVAAGIILSPFLVNIMAPGFAPEERAVAVTLTRMMFPFLMLVSVGALAMGVLNSLGSFFIPAIAPALSNLAYIIFLLATKSHLSVWNLAFAVLTGGAFHMLLQVYWCSRLKFTLRPRRPSLGDPQLRSMMALFLPYAAGLSLNQLNPVISRMLGSFLDGGSISVLTYADRVLQLPLGLFVIAISQAVLPVLSRQDPNDTASFCDFVRGAMRFNLFVVLPVAAGLCFVVMLLNYFITSLASYASTTAASSLLAFTVLVLVIGGVFRLMTRSGFASVVLMLILEGLLLVGFLLDSSAYEGLFPEIMEQLSLFDRFYDFVYGIFDLGSVVYFLTVIGVFLFLSVQSLEKRRWSE